MTDLEAMQFSKNFTIPPESLSLIKLCQFSGLPSEDPCNHVEVFLEICEAFRIEGDAIHLQLFSLSLRDEARTWLKSMPASTFTNWDQLEQAFLNKFFPSSKTTYLRIQIINFDQKDWESLSDTWERYKDLLESCIHHGLEKWWIIINFYNSLDYFSRASLDFAAIGSLMNKGLRDAYEIIEKVVSKHHYWASEKEELLETQIVRNMCEEVIQEEEEEMEVEDDKSVMFVEKTRDPEMDKYTGLHSCIDMSKLAPPIYLPSSIMKQLILESMSIPKHMDILSLVTKILRSSKGVKLQGHNRNFICTVRSFISISFDHGKLKNDSNYFFMTHT